MLFYRQFRYIIECNSHHSESDVGESLSVLELELLVEPPITFDFRRSCCFIFSPFFVSLFVFESMLGILIFYWRGKERFREEGETAKKQ